MRKNIPYIILTLLFITSTPSFCRENNLNTLINKKFETNKKPELKQLTKTKYNLKPGSNELGTKSNKKPVIENKGSTSPTSYLYTCEAPLPLKIFNIDDKSNIKVKVNDRLIDNSLYTYRKKKFNINYAMKSDTAVIKVIATNQYGSDSYQKSFICNYSDQEKTNQIPSRRCLVSIILHYPFFLRENSRGKKNL